MKTTLNNTLYQTVTDAARFLFDGGIYNPKERDLLVEWILDHQNRHRGFIFYPTIEDRENGIRLFSGEKPRAKFLSNNIVELETLRLLALLQPEAPQVRQILQEANERLFPLCFANGCTVGECAHASIAFCRYLTIFDLHGSQTRINQALKVLKEKHHKDGRWQGFPFFFTLLWLTELPSDVAQSELLYARDYCEKLLNHQQVDPLREKILRQALV